MFRVKKLLGIVILGLVFLVCFGFIMTSDVYAGGNNNGKNCEELLLGPERPAECEWVYICENNISDEDPFFDDPQPVWEFFFSNTGRFKLEWTQAVFGPEPGPFPTVTLWCQCKPTGSFNNPNFDASNVVFCTGPTSNPSANRDFAVEGHVVGNGKSIIQGNILNDLGTYWVYQCDRVLNCPD